MSSIQAFRDEGIVGVVAPFPPPVGGMSLQAQKLERQLRRQGIPVIAVPTNPQPPAVLSWVARVPALRTAVREMQYLISLMRVLPKVKVIHHLAASGLSFLLQSVPVIVFARLFRKRLIVNYRGGYAAQFLARWSRTVVPLLRQAAVLAVPSAFLQRVFAGYGLKTELLPNIANTHDFPFKKRDSFLPRFLTTRHLEPMYNIECILRAFAVVQLRCPEAALTIAGEGSEEGHLKQLAAELRLRNVDFCGLVSPERLPALYAAHDIYLNGSRVDNFPGALVEAACCGLPIVSSSAGGIPDMLRHRQNGLLVEVDDYNGMADAVLELMRDQGLAQQLTRTARRWVETYSWKNIFPQLLQFYGMLPNAMHPSESAEVASVGLSREE